jgi:hypothetical protein
LENEHIQRQYRHCKSFFYLTSRHTIRRFTKYRKQTIQYTTKIFFSIPISSHSKPAYALAETHNAELTLCKQYICGISQRGTVPESSAWFFFVHVSAKNLPELLYLLLQAASRSEGAAEKATLRRIQRHRLLRRYR